MTPLMKRFKLIFPQLQKHWYFNDGASGGKHDIIYKWYFILKIQEPPRGPEPTKLIFVVHPNYLAQAKKIQGT